MGKTCAQLFEGYECDIIGDPNEPVGGLAYRSDAVCPQDAFFCVVGFNVDGHSFAQDAVDRGAKVLVVERKLDLENAADVTEVVVSDTRKAMAHAAANFYDHPSADFQLVGVTGTNGKTTTTHLVEQIARAMGKKTGVIGTVGIQIGDEYEKAEHTTPESIDLEKTFARLRDEHCEVVAMEVSSHALDLSRTGGATFAVTAFTNLTHDHLDYHENFYDYFEAKARLFSAEYPAKRVICIEDEMGIGDEFGQTLYERCLAAGDDMITVGFDSSTQIYPLDVSYTPTHTELTLDVCGDRFEITYPLVGSFNVENVMCAFGIGLQLGFPADDIANALAHVSAVAGRLERIQVEDDCGVAVYVDYAHTPDALYKAIETVRDISDYRVLVVFGCGGDRDAIKRPTMGNAALLADYAIVTSDNPRHEDPEAIIEDIVSGMAEDEIGHYEVVVDRRDAIARAIDLAMPGDSILIAGKGHEDYQLVGDEVLSFDDRVVAAELLDAVAKQRSQGGVW